MEKIKVKAEVREERGKSKVKLLRANDIIPAVVYKDGKDALSIKVGKGDLIQALHTSAGENVLVTLNIKGDKAKAERTCIIKEIQKNPVKGHIVHVDFNEISLTEKLKVKVSIHSKGEAEGAVKDGGVLEHAMWEVEVECLPSDIPEKIEVDVTAMKIGDTMYVKDLSPIPGVKILSDPELATLTVKPPAKEEVAEEAPAEDALAEPEIIEKGKKEAEEIDEGAPAEKPAKEDKPEKKE